MPDRRYHHGDLRAALLARAEQTLREKGVDALSLRELARDIGVSHAAPSRHFRDKRALLDALALTGMNRLLAELERVGSACDTFGARITALARTYVDFSVGEPELHDVMFAGKHDPDASEEMRAAAQRLGALIFEVITEGQRAGEIRPDDPARIELLMFSTLHGFAALAASEVVPVSAGPGAVDAIVEDLMRGLRPR
ncbi:TetR/AcrR family transcriptional regulator [Streptomyces sp. NPDC057137]|uniref:TetR/AcrR family transcriptional regulator n=1 Tax=Streptomyces sp. NPDC057137 TaxID=3346030 RepID=UPI003633A71C